MLEYKYGAHHLAAQRKKVQDLETLVNHLRANLNPRNSDQILMWQKKAKELKAEEKTLGKILDQIFPEEKAILDLEDEILILQSTTKPQDCEGQKIITEKQREILRLQDKIANRE